MGDKKPEPLVNGLPKRLLRELNEHTVGGFALFFFNPDTGFPQHLLTFDSPAHCLAMRQYMTDWTNALQEVYLDGAKANILRNLNTDEQEGE